MITGGVSVEVNKELVEDANAAAAYELFDIVDEETVCGDQDVVRFENCAELTGLFEVEQDFAFAGCPKEDGVKFFE